MNVNFKKRTEKIIIGDTPMTLAELINEIENNPNKLIFPFLIISPYSNFKKVWNFIIFILLIYTVVLFPVRIAFFEGDNIFFNTGKIGKIKYYLFNYVLSQIFFMIF